MKKYSRILAVFCRHYF